MGQIANQMFAEWCCKIARKIDEKRNLKKNADQQDKSRTSENADHGGSGKETE